MTVSVSLILNAVGLGVVVASLGAFAVARGVGQKPVRQARLWMALFIGLLGYDHVVQLADGLGLITRAPVLIGIDFLHLPLLVAALYMHVRLVTPTGNAVSGEGTPGPVLWPWASVAGLWALLIPLVFLDGELKRAVFVEAAFTGGEDLPEITQAPLLVVAVVGVLLYWLAWLTMLVWAGVAMVGRLIRRERWLRTQVSTFEGLGLSPIRRLLWLCAAGIALVIIDQVLVLFGGAAWPEWSSDLYVAILALSFTLLTLGAALEPEQPLPGGGRQWRSHESGLRPLRTGRTGLSADSGQDRPGDAARRALARPVPDHGHALPGLFGQVTPGQPGAQRRSGAELL